MKSILLGTDDQTGEEVRIPTSAFSTHFHLVGGTGKGKTTAIHTMLQPLLSDPFNKSAFFIIDRLGNFSQELLLWISSRFCPDHVRKRLVYVQPSREDLVSPLNPLLYESSAHGYFRVERATEIILRAWESMNIEAMPRLARWVFNAFWAAAQLGLTISDCVHLLLPGSKYHDALLRMLPDRLKAEWQEITQSRGEMLRVLDSTRNRLRPYFDSDILRRMFGSHTSRLDVLRLMRDGRIVILDLAQRNRLSSQLSDTIGALTINEVIATVRNVPRGVQYPTYLFLDEFQNFVGPDVESALPETRQLGLKLVLSHQSFAQLTRGEYDLTSMIFAAQSRMIFGVQGEDADLLANEVASITFDSRKIKDQMWSRRQLVKGHRRENLRSWSEAEGGNSSTSDATTKQSSESSGRSGRDMWMDPVLNESKGTSKNDSQTRTDGRTFSRSEGGHETLVPEYDNFMELSSRNYESFQEQRSGWARDIRNLHTGQAILRLVNEPQMRVVNIKRSAPGVLGYDLHTIARKFPQAIERMEKLVEENFHSEFFVSASEIDREQEARLQAILTGNQLQPSRQAVAQPIDSPFA